MTLRHAAAQGQAQAQAVRRRVGLAAVEVAVKQGREPLIRDALSGIGDRQQHQTVFHLQLHRDGAAGVREFKGIGQKLVHCLLQRGRRHGTDMALHGADEPQLQTQQGRQISNLLADLADQGDDVPILEGQRGAVGEPGSGGQAVHQPEQPVIALVQEGGLLIQRRVVFPGLGRRQLGHRQMQIAQGGPELGRYIGKQGCQAVFVLFHGKLLSGARGAVCSIYGRRRRNPGKPCLKHQQHIKNRKERQEFCRIMSNSFPDRHAGRGFQNISK